MCPRERDRDCLDDTELLEGLVLLARANSPLLLFDVERGPNVVDWKLARDAWEDIDCLGSEGNDSVIDGLAVALPDVLNRSSSCSTLGAGVHLPLSVAADSRGGGGESAPWIAPSHDTFLLVLPPTPFIAGDSSDVRALTCKIVSSEKRDCSPRDG